MLVGNKKLGPSTFRENNNVTPPKTNSKFAPQEWSLEDKTFAFLFEMVPFFADDSVIFIFGGVKIQWFSWQQKQDTFPRKPGNLQKCSDGCFQK